jgi:hypothetical protein
MKRMVVIVLVTVLCGVLSFAGVYVRGRHRFPERYHHGNLQPAYDITCEWWFDGERVAFAQEGFTNLEGFRIQPSLRLVYDAAARRLLYLDLDARTWLALQPASVAEAPLDDATRRQLTRFRLDGDIEALAETQPVQARECRLFGVKEWIAAGGYHRYERRRRVAVSPDVPFHWELWRDMNRSIRLFFNPQPSYLAGLDGMAGFILATSEEALSRGDNVQWTFEIVQMDERELPADVFAVPDGYRQMDAVTLGELFSMLQTIYFSGW